MPLISHPTFMHNFLSITTVSLFFLFNLAPHSLYSTYHYVSYKHLMQFFTKCCPSSLQNTCTVPIIGMVVLEKKPQIYHIQVLNILTYQRTYLFFSTVRAHICFGHIFRKLLTVFSLAVHCKKNQTFLTYIILEYIYSLLLLCTTNQPQLYESNYTTYTYVYYKTRNLIESHLYTVLYMLGLV